MNLRNQVIGIDEETKGILFEVMEEIEEELKYDYTFDVGSYQRDNDEDDEDDEDDDDDDDDEGDSRRRSYRRNDEEDEADDGDDNQDDEEDDDDSDLRRSRKRRKRGWVLEGKEHGRSPQRRKF